ncbi:MAG: DNA internalization-related competence protein ComEC/Rec2 [Deltaproteobacteria bacterium]|nr:MAG: DNA internalization-related competence protein ComEC/Rec2 [Deltaproteobacteria bacterium]
MLPVHRPLAYLVVGFCSGIVAGRYLPIASSILAFFSAFLCGLLSYRTLRGRTSLLLPPALFVVMGGLASTGIPDPDQPPATIKELLRHKRVVVMGRIGQSPEKGPGKTRIRLRLEAFKEEENWKSISGNMLLDIHECQRDWSVGQRLLGGIRLRPVRNFNNPGAFNYRQHLADQRIWVRGYVRRDTDLVPLGKPVNSWPYLLDRIRSKSRAFLWDWLPPDHASLYGALLLGERFALSAELRELLYSSGVGHLLAISGLHLGLVAGFVFLVLHVVLLGVPAVAGRWGARPTAALVAFPFALAYGLLTGMGLPALRAIIMLGVFSLALVSQRENDLFNTLLLAALIILILYPESLFAASFQLSFIGVAALVLVLPLLPVPTVLRHRDGQEEKWRRRGRRLYQFFCASVILSLYTAPVVLYHFHRLTPVGIVTNLLVVPLVGFFILPAGLLALCLLPFSTLLAGFLLTLGSLGLGMIMTIATKCASLSWATVWPGTPTPWQVGLAYFLLLVPFANTRRWHRTGLLICGSLVLVAPLMLPAEWFFDKSCLRVTYLDVSQGNSAVVEFPGKGAMLIDGGGFHGSSFDVGRNVVAPYLWHRRIRRLESMVLSHAHPDHFRGLPFVANHFPIKEFWSTNVSTGDPDLAALMAGLAKKNVVCLGPKELSSPRNIQGVDIQVLHPPHDFRPISNHLTNRELNDFSLVLRVTYKHVSFIFPGDIEKVAEYRLAKMPDLAPVDVLLVPHHGSRTSSSPILLKRLQPRIAVFSVGFDNPFHLPANRVSERYRLMGAQTYRTDRHGAITIRTDGHQIEVETYLKGK